LKQWTGNSKNDFWSSLALITTGTNWSKRISIAQNLGDITAPLFPYSSYCSSKGVGKKHGM
jgi:hypothetical protein